MAMIKCPECGHQVSDKAPYCPNCGVEIAGKVVKCPNCGEIFFRNEQICPNCHKPLLSGKTGQADETTRLKQADTARNPGTPKPAQVGGKPEPTSGKPQGPRPAKPTVPTTPQNKKKTNTVLIVSFVFALIVCALCFYFYKSAKSGKEQEAYEFALKSSDPQVLQMYLDNNTDAPEDHLIAITERLDSIKRGDQDWNNALVSGTKSALTDYIARHPSSEHLAEAKHKIDSLDWVDAKNENTVQAVQAYLDQHADGEYVDDAMEAMKQIKATTVQPEDKTIVSTALRHFFQAVNSNDAAALKSSVAETMTNFLGKRDAVREDMATYLHKIYKEDIVNMNWRLGQDYKISKKSVGDERYEYTAAVSATQEIDKKEAESSTRKKYKITATINSDGLISSMTMTEIAE